MKKSGHSTIIVFLLSFTLFGIAEASVISVLSSQDTYITEHAGLGGVTSIHGSDGALWVARGTGTYREIPLYQFDLTAYANQTIISPFVEFQIELISGNSLPSQSISIREILVGWNENSASFANFGGTGYNEGSHTGVNLTTRNVVYSGISESIIFNLPTEVVQGWLNDPSTNNGLILISNTTTNVTDLVFSSKEGTVSPRLNFELAPIPTPPTALLFGSGILLLFGKREKSVSTIRTSRTSNAPS